VNTPACIALHGTCSASSYHCGSRRRILQQTIALATTRKNKFKLVEDTWVAESPAHGRVPQGAKLDPHMTTTRSLQGYYLACAREPDRMTSPAVASVQPPVGLPVSRRWSRKTGSFQSPFPTDGGAPRYEYGLFCVFLLVLPVQCACWENSMGVCAQLGSGAKHAMRLNKESA
jgi:hypothetical protein